jgi:hypothetical protein
MTNEETHLRKLLQAALANKPLQITTTQPSAWRDADRRIQGLDLIRLIVNNPQHYRIKPEPKVCKYQTRAYIINGKDTRIWVSDDPRTQTQIEKHHLQFGSFQWLSETQDHEVTIHE